MKRYIGLARVSSREQEREGFSLDVQEDAFHEYARRRNGVVDKLFRIAETATKAEQRKIFREAIEYAKRNAAQYDGMLFYKIDRAARNIRDLLTLEEIESDYDLPFISVTQPVENTPTGRMIRRTLATIGAFQTEQQSLDIQEGIAKRVALGWFPSRCPYGYRNLRVSGRAVADIHPQDGLKVRRAFELRAYENLLVEEIVERMFREGVVYTVSKPRFSLGKMNAILHDMSYIGFVRFRGLWHPGLQAPLIDKTTWDLVRVSFGEQRYRSHEFVYAGELIRCGYCGRPVTGEEKEKQTKTGPRAYIYYRCARYQRPGHPRIRLREQELDLQAAHLLSEFRAESSEVQGLIVNVALARLAHEQSQGAMRAEEAKRQLSLIESQREELVNMRLSKLLSDGQFAAKHAELVEREAAIRHLVETAAQVEIEHQRLAALAQDVFHMIRQDWAAMERRKKHEILRLLFGGFVLDGTALVPSNGTPLELFRAG